MTESVIDFPKDTLCPEIWDKVIAPDGVRETYNLKAEVEGVLMNAAKAIEDTLKTKFKTYHITGSITSNSYTENADIDLHLLTDKQFSDEEAETINKAVRSAYTKVSVGKHPVEVYFQPNKFQDMMSVGCYDIEQHMWLVGPEIVDKDFNPYREYYADIQDKSEDLAKQVRNMIFSIYEIAIVYKKNANTDYALAIRGILLDKLEEVQKLYDDIRNMRKVYSSPNSEKEALKFRSSRKWKVADASFKLFDKYGYMPIMKLFIEDYKLMSSSDSVDEEVVEDILRTVKHYINNADKLAEKELYEDEELLDEGAVQNVLLAALLAIPGILPAKTILQSIDKNKTYQATMNDLNSQKKVRMVGDYTALQAANIIARTLYAEARNDGKDKGFMPVASVIYNRAKGNKADFAKACLKPLQFSCWNKMTDDEKDPKQFKVKLPKTVADSEKNLKLWQQAMEIAADMLADAFKPITDANSYYNPDKANPSWGKELVKVKVIGSHKFGYLKNHAKFI